MIMIMMMACIEMVVVGVCGVCPAKSIQIRIKRRGVQIPCTPLNQATAMVAFSFFNYCLNQRTASEKEQLAAVMQEHGIEWGKKGAHKKHLSALDFEKLRTGKGSHRTGNEESGSAGRFEEVPA